MTYQQREEYTAPVCEVLKFEVEENITSTGKPEFNPGGPSGQDDDEQP